MCCSTALISLEQHTRSVERLVPVSGVSQFDVAQLLTHSLSKQPASSLCLFGCEGRRQPLVLRLLAASFAAAAIAAATLESKQQQGDRRHRLAVQRLLAVRNMMLA